MTAADTVYSAVVREASGRISCHQVRAASPAEARVQLMRNGTAVLSCEVATESGHIFKWRGWGNTASSRSGLDVAAFAQDFAALIDAGLSVTEALQTLSAREPAGTLQNLLRQVTQTVSEGRTLSGALQSTGAFPELLVATVAASERTGDLGKGLSRYALHQTEMRVLRDKLISASVYPLVLLVVGGLVVMFLMGVVIPRFAGLMEGTRTQLPLLSSGLMAWGRLVAEHPSVLIAFFGTFAAMLGWVIVHFRNQGIRSRWLQKIPFVAKVVREFQHLQLYRTTSILVSRGIVIHRAMEHGMTLLSADDRQRLERGLLLMQEGLSMSAALAEAGLSDVVAASMLKVAERTGSMPEMLERIAQFYERRLQRSIDVATRVIEPALMIVIGTVIGAIVVLMYLPIFDLASSLQ
ncbi:MAG: type II secretion system F family protein [Polaromonas sp.]|nr:type II secretion system F family protein [Polaromonas sp.]MDP3752135.1 type II secretion system F family protein [Polaromonas sp.]